MWANDNGELENCVLKLYQIAIEKIACDSKHKRFSSFESKLYQLVENYVGNRDSEKGILRVLESYVADDNRMPQRRIYVTPSLTLVAPLKLEASNCFLRKERKLLDYFVRINLLEDDKGEPWFNSEKESDILKNFVEPLIEKHSFCFVET
jgi:hypothetical protein